MFLEIQMALRASLLSLKLESWDILNKVSVFSVYLRSLIFSNRQLAIYFFVYMGIGSVTHHRFDTLIEMKDFNLG